MKVFETSIGGRPLKVEIGQIAKQAAGSCLIRYGETGVISTVCFKESTEIRDFFPLMVIYQERLYAGGKIPGGFLRREGRPTENETLIARLIDRPIRPLFPKGYQDEVQIVNTVVSSDLNASPDMTALIGSSIALMLSKVPFEGPIAGVNIGYVDGKFLINPNFDDLKDNQIELAVAGTKDAINMVEASSMEVSEDLMLKAILFAHEEIKKIIAFQEQIIAEMKPEKMVPKLFLSPQTLFDDLFNKYAAKFKAALLTFEKLARDEKVNAIRDEISTNYMASQEDDINGDFKKEKEHEFIINQVVEDIIAQVFRTLITKDKIRVDGRKITEIRPLSSQVDLLPRPHGSSLFTRGQTQSMGIVTLGALSDSQIIEDLTEIDTKRFLLHYNFPPFSVGETGKYGSPGRREIGHGNLARRALQAVIPSEDDFPYTIRVVSEILESNGSSSMATVCSGTLALMAAGVPIKKPVAGIAMGLIKENKDYTILTDIQGLEDHLGDMDFKVAGTKDGITALQMDIKIKGINEAILKEALADAKIARFFILENITSTIKEPRKELSKYAPKVALIKIDPEKIKDVIGSGGKVINKIIEKYNNVKIDIEQDGRVYIMHEDQKYVNLAKEEISLLTKVAQVGEIYEGIVKRIEKFGAFVEIWPGQEGLLHISKIANERINDVNEVLKLNDQVIVKVINIDEQGRVDLSRKDALKPENNNDKKENKKEFKKEKKVA